MGLVVLLCSSSPRSRQSTASQNNRYEWMWIYGQKEDEGRRRWRRGRHLLIECFNVQTVILGGHTEQDTLFTCHTTSPLFVKRIHSANDCHFPHLLVSHRSIRLIVSISAWYDERESQGLFCLYFNLNGKINHPLNEEIQSKWAFPSPLSQCRHLVVTTHPKISWIMDESVVYLSFRECQVIGYILCLP